MKTSQSFFIKWSTVLLILICILPVSAQINPPTGNAIQLNGSTDYFSIPDDAALKPASVTVEAYVRVNAFTSTKTGGNGDNQFILHKQNTRSVQFEGYTLLFNETSKTFAGIASSAAGVFSIQVTPNDFIELGQWYHLALTVNSTELRFYVNGVQQGTAVPTGFSLDYGPNPLFVGRSGDISYDGFLNGQVDEVRIWNTIRTQSEIQSTISTTLTGSEPGLVAYYKLDENGQGAGLAVTNSATATGSTLNGTTQGTGSTPVFTNTAINLTPPAGNAIQLNGSTDYVEVNDDPALDLNSQLTVEAWIKLQGSTGTYQNVVRNDLNYILGHIDNGYNTFYVLVYNGGGWQYLASTKPPSWFENQWVHVAVTYESGSFNLYLNGELDATTSSVTGTLNTTSSPLHIGSVSYAASEYFNGNVDEVRIWNTFRTQTEIQSALGATLSGSESGLVAYYKMDETGSGSGQTVANSATATGAALNGTTQGTGSTPVFSESVPVENSIKFDGSSQEAQLGTWFNYQEFTISMWVKPAASQVAYANIIDNNHTGSRAWVFQQDFFNTNQYLFGASGTSAPVAVSLSANVWQQVTLVSTATQKLAYVNGILVGTEASSSPINYDGSQSLRLANWGGCCRNWSGEMDEVRIYDRAFSDSEVAASVYSVESPTAPNLQAYYKMNETGGSTLLDSSPNGRHGTLINGPTFQPSGVPVAANNNFVTVWNLATTGSGETQLTFLTETSGTVSYTWQEISPGNASGSGSWNGGSLTITGLPTGATIRLQIEPTNFQRIIISNGPDANRLTLVENWGSTSWTSMEHALAGCINLQVTATDIPNLSGVANMAYMFSGCSTLNSPSNINAWNTGTVTNMEALFYDATAFNQNIGAWNTASVTTMSYMFGQAFVFDQNIGAWNTGAVTQMEGMFRDAYDFNQDIGNWDVSSVTNMSYMFSTASTFNQPLDNWNTGSVTSMLEMFRFAISFNQDIGSWDVANVLFMTNMLNNSALSIANYDATLIGWAAQTLNPNVSLGANGRGYCGATAARSVLVNAPNNWIITGDTPSCPAITSITPSGGGIGTIVTITGTNFSTTPGENIVKFNGTAAVVSASSTTSITTTVPSGATTGSVTVTLNSQTATSPGVFSVGAVPTISSFTPTLGPVGTMITIAGTNFSTIPASNTVKFNGTDATVTASTATSITTTVPAGASTGAITVTVDGIPGTSSGNFSVTLPGDFFANGQAASVVLGQPNFTTGTPGTSATKTNGAPVSAVDPTTGKVFVCDGANNRILRFSSTDANNSGSAAEAVLGQTDFTTSTPSLSQSKFNGPWTITVDNAGNLWVADFNNNRVLRFANASNLSNGANATSVLGQSDFVSNASPVQADKVNAPAGVAVDNLGNLYVGQRGSNRVSRFDNAASLSNGSAATAVFGQPNFTSAGGAISQSGFNRPNGVAVDNLGNLWVSDELNGRVLRFANAATASSGALAASVLGKANFTTGGQPAPAQNTITCPLSVSADNNGTVYVADWCASRILVYPNAASLANGANATYVLGQPNFTSAGGALNASGLANPGISAAAVDANGNVWVADSQNRTLRYDRASSPTPTITSVAPSSGVVGATVTITGTDFDNTPGNNIVKFNGTTAVVSASSATSITATVPAGATTGSITVTVNGQTGTSSSTFTVIQPPTITSFAPLFGPVGTTVTITGTNFDTTPAINIVKFNGTDATVSASTSTSLTVTVPLGATTGQITVTVDSQTATSAANYFVGIPAPVITSFTPTTASVGTNVTISGNYFDPLPANNLVQFSGTTATVTASTVTSISTTVPLGVTSGAITVTVNGQTGTSSSNFTLASPIISSVSPSFGLVGTIVVITGNFFSPIAANNLVKFNGIDAVVTASTTTTITTSVPAGATEGPITVTISGASVSSPGNFLVGNPAPTIESFTPSSGAEGTEVTITGTFFSATATDNVVQFNNTTASVLSATETSITTTVPLNATTGRLSVTRDGLKATSATDFIIRISDSDSLALVALYEATNGSKWSNQTNWLTGNVDTWFGVTVTNTKIVKLTLPDNGLAGQIPSEVATLDELTEIDFSGNELTSIPDLSSVPVLTALDLSQNKLDFATLEPVSGMSGLLYAPQDSVDLADNTLVSLGSEKIFQATLGGSANSYQWFKNDEIISGATNSSYTLTNISFKDEGSYRYEATNSQLPNLTLYGRRKKLRVSSIERDSIALRQLYEQCGGNGWTNKTNWLTTALATGNWFGITIAGNRVTEINLPNNNISGKVPPVFADIENLVKVDLSSNQLQALPDVSKLANLSQLNVSNNQLDFGSLIATTSISSVNYLNQAQIGSPTFTTVAFGTDVPVRVSVKGTGNLYQWFLNDAPVSGATDSVYTIPAINRFNMGNYRAEITNPTVPGLTLVSANKRVLATATISGRLLETPSLPVTKGQVVLLKINPVGAWDTTRVQSVTPDGAFLLEKVLLDDYVLVAIADSEEFPNDLPTYVQDKIYWEEADRIELNENREGLEITMQRKPVEKPQGEGLLSGTFLGPDEPGGKTLANKRIANAGVSIRRKTNQGRPQEEDLQLISYIFTNEQGEFSFENLEQGNYLLNLQYPGFPMDAESYVNIIIGSGLEKQVFVVAKIIDNKIVVRKLFITGWDESEDQFNVYPNPVSTQFTIDVLAPSYGLTYAIFNTMGQNLNTGPLGSFGPNAIQVGSLPPGVYQVAILQHESILKTFRIVIN